MPPHRLFRRCATRQIDPSGLTSIHPACTDKSRMSSRFAGFMEWIISTPSRNVDRPQHRLHRQEPHRRGYPEQPRDPLVGALLILDGDAGPDVRDRPLPDVEPASQQGRLVSVPVVSVRRVDDRLPLVLTVPAEPAIELGHPVGTLGEDLEVDPGTSRHRAVDDGDELEGDVLVEEVEHRPEHPPRPPVSPGPLRERRERRADPCGVDAHLARPAAVLHEPGVGAAAVGERGQAFRRLRGVAHRRSVGGPTRGGDHRAAVDPVVERQVTPADRVLQAAFGGGVGRGGGDHSDSVVE